MAKLLYNSTDGKWKCSNCGKNFTADELAEAFDNQFFDVEGQLKYSQKGFFTPGYCTNCKEKLDEVENIS